MTRIFVLYGQGSYATSAGMYGLANSLKALGNTVVSIHSWTDQQTIVNDIVKLPATVRVVLIGYSLGGNAITLIAAALPKRKIDLLVAYDPSVQSALQPIGGNVGKAYCYHNNGTWYFGGARLTGKNVVTVEINEFHLQVCYDASLHQRTLAAVKALG